MAKTYPWNASKHAHDIFFRLNRCWLAMQEETDIETLDRLERLHNELDDLLDICQGGGIVWLTGKQFGLARECELWAAANRGR